MTHTPPETGRDLFERWKSMKRRSTAGSAEQRRKPGYEGVSRDPRWDDFDAFCADMGPSYFDGAVLGRIGDRGDYTAENCRWQTRAESSREMQESSARIHQLPDGRYAVDVAGSNGISHKVWWDRVHKHGWTIEDAVTVPIGSRNRRSGLTDSDDSAIRARYAAGGISQRALASEYGVNQATVARIINRKDT